MNQLLTSLKSAAEVVVLDSPPSMVADAQILSAKVDGVILVVHPGHTQVNAALGLIEQMKRTGARILGVVLNHIPPRDPYYYYSGYRYYHLPYYYSTQKKQGKAQEQQEPQGAAAVANKAAVHKGATARHIWHKILKVVSFGTWHHRHERTRLHSEYDWSNRRSAAAGRARSQVWTVRSDNRLTIPMSNEDDKSNKLL